MPVTQVHVDADTRERLGDQAVESMRRRFDATGECQSCKQDLGDDSISVVVLQLAPGHARANAHHLRCADAVWQSGYIEVRGDAQITDWTMCFTVEASADGEPFALPIFVVHPALDQIVLAQGDDGRWRLDPFYDLLGPGFQARDPRTPMFEVRNPAIGWKIPALNDREVAVVAPDSPAIWRAWATPAFATAVREQDGLMVIVNTTLAPRDMPSGITGGQLNALMRSSDTASGWVSLSGRILGSEARDPAEGRLRQDAQRSTSSASTQSAEGEAPQPQRRRSWSWPWSRRAKRSGS